MWPGAGGNFGLTEAETVLAGVAADIVVVNLDLDFERAVVELETFSRAHSDVKIVVLTEEENPERISRLVRAGARGVVTRRAPAGSVVEAIRRVSRGLRWTSIAPPADAESAHEYASGWESLTPREREIAAAAAKGDRYGEIAESLGISPHTVRNHLRHVFEKLGVNSRVELAVYSAKIESR